MHKPIHSPKYYDLIDKRIFYKRLLLIRASTDHDFGTCSIYARPTIQEQLLIRSLKEKAKKILRIKDE